jgi:hypothetical protein
MICATGQASIPARCVIQTVPGRSADQRVTPDICAHSRRPECDLTTFCRDAIRPWVCCRVRPLRRSGSCPELTSLSCREEVPLRRTLYVPNTGEAFSATPGIGRPAVTSPEWNSDEEPFLSGCCQDDDLGSHSSVPMDRSTVLPEPPVDELIG